MMKRFFIALLLLCLTAFAVFAEDDAGNPNDPTVNEDANACFEDGTMAGNAMVTLMAMAQLTSMKPIGPGNAAGI